jgi:hypothetical protein
MPLNSEIAFAASTGCFIYVLGILAKPKAILGSLVPPYSSLSKQRWLTEDSCLVDVDSFNIEKNKRTVQSEKQKATCRYSKKSYSLLIVVKLYLLSLFFNIVALGKRQ